MMTTRCQGRCSVSRSVCEITALAGRAAGAACTVNQNWKLERELQDARIERAGDLAEGRRTDGKTETRGARRRTGQRNARAESCSSRWKSFRTKLQGLTFADAKRPRDRRIDLEKRRTGNVHRVFYQRALSVPGAGVANAAGLIQQAGGRTRVGAQRGCQHLNGTLNRLAAESAVSDTSVDKNGR